MGSVNIIELVVGYVEMLNVYTNFTQLQAGIVDFSNFMCAKLVKGFGEDSDRPFRIYCSIIHMCFCLFNNNLQVFYLIT